MTEDLGKPDEEADVEVVEADVVEPDAGTKDAGQTSVPVPARKFLRIISTPPGAQITIDGVKSGVTPAHIKLTTSPHRVIFTLPGYESVTKSANPARTRTLRAKLAKIKEVPPDPINTVETPDPATLVKLYVRPVCEVPGSPASISIDGKSYGVPKKARLQVQLTLGTHKISARGLGNCEGYTAAKTLKVTEKSRGKTIHLNLRRRDP